MQVQRIAWEAIKQGYQEGEKQTSRETILNSRTGSAASPTKGKAPDRVKRICIGDAHVPIGRGENR
jgi:hypothetical protein